MESRPSESERPPRFVDCRKWKTAARPRKTLPGSPDGHENNKRARKEPSRGHPQGPRGSGCSETPFVGLRICDSRRLSSCLAVGQQVGHERAHQSELGFEQQNRFRNLREIQRMEKKAFRARADAAQSARQGGTEPGTTRFRDGRRTTGPPAPRRGPGAPTAQPRPRGPDLESAQI